MSRPRNLPWGNLIRQGLTVLQIHERYPNQFPKTLEETTDFLVKAGYAKSSAKIFYNQLVRNSYLADETKKESNQTILNLEQEVIDLKQANDACKEQMQTLKTEYDKSLEDAANAQTALVEEVQRLQESEEKLKKQYNEKEDELRNIICENFELKKIADNATENAIKIAKMRLAEERKKEEADKNREKKEFFNLLKANPRFIMSKEADPSNIMPDTCSLQHVECIDIIKKATFVTLTGSLLAEMDKIKSKNAKSELARNLQEFSRSTLLDNSGKFLLSSFEGEDNYVDNNTIYYLKILPARLRPTLLTADCYLATRAIAWNIPYILYTRS